MRSACMAAVLLFLLACRDSEDAPPAATPGVGGALRVSRGGVEVLAAAARGAYCPDDTTLALVAVGDRWTAALSLRTPWPAAAADTFTVVAAAGGAGSARAAVRPVSQEVGMALVGARGLVRLRPGRTASGTFDFTAPTGPGSRDSVRVTGTFAGVPVRADLCADR